MLCEGGAGARRQPARRRPGRRAARLRGARPARPARPSRARSTGRAREPRRTRRASSRRAGSSAATTPTSRVRSCTRRKREPDPRRRADALGCDGRSPVLRCPFAMAIREILEYPDPRLREVAKPVAAVTRRDSRARRRHGRNDVRGARLRPGRDADRRRPARLRHRLSPARTSRAIFGSSSTPRSCEKDGVQTWNEGCLSFPGVTEEIKRAEHVKVRALDRDGKAVRARGRRPARRRHPARDRSPERRADDRQAERAQEAHDGPQARQGQRTKKGPRGPGVIGRGGELHRRGPIDRAQRLAGKVSRTRVPMIFWHCSTSPGSSGAM